MEKTLQLSLPFISSWFNLLEHLKKEIKLRLVHLGPVWISLFPGHLFSAGSKLTRLDSALRSGGGGTIDTQFCPGWETVILGQWFVVMDPKSCPITSFISSNLTSWTPMSDFSALFFIGSEPFPLGEMEEGPLVGFPKTPVCFPRRMKFPDQQVKWV